ncbi:MAG: ADP-ribosylglycohydrolase family protein, partial [Planctomycetaceae bacterium]
LREDPRMSRAVNAFVGSLVADAMAMPVHWYYDQRALLRDYPEFATPDPGYVAPRSPHADSILWRSSYTPLNEKGDILREQAEFWGRRGVHYHQFLAAGENTLNYRLAAELFALLRRTRDYDPERWLDHYVAFMLEPGRHRDTYVEEYHRHFFTNLGAGRKPINCGVRDVHIGGLVPVAAIVAGLGPRHPDLRWIVRVHVGLTHKDDEVLAAADALVRMLVRLTRDDRAAEDVRDVILEEGRDWISEAKVRAWERAAATGPAACPDRAVVGGILSPACYIPDAFPAALYLAWRHAGDVGSGLLANARCGGDNCHRGAVVGPLLAATAPIPRPVLEGLSAAGRLSDSHDDSQPVPESIA